MILWCILFVLCWPLAILALILFPVVWLILLPFRLIWVSLEAVLSLFKAIVFLPARLLGCRPQSC